MSPQNMSSTVAKKNSSQQHSSGYSDSHGVPIKSADWEQPDFEEINVCMEVTAYIYHWQ